MLNGTYSEVIIHIAGEDGAIIIWSPQIGWPVISVLSKLFLKPFLVIDHYLFAFGLQEADKCLDDPQRSTSQWNQNQDLAQLSHHNITNKTKYCVFNHYLYNLEK